MLFKDIKVGKIYKVNSLCEDTNVKVVGKSKVKGFYVVKYEYPEMNIFGCTKGKQFSDNRNFPNIKETEE